MRAFVTGGTGFIGSHLVEYLLEQGYEVRALVRRQARWLEGLPVTLVRATDMEDPALEKTLADVEYVFHVAGLVRAPTWEPLYRANVEATERLLALVWRVNPSIRRVLVVSSQAAVGPSLNGPVTEESPLRPISAYGRSKALMEARIRERFAELPYTIVRPPAVYGPRERDIYTFFRLVATGVAPIIGTGEEPELSLVHVQDLVRGLYLAATRPEGLRQVFFISSERFYSWQELRDVTLRALGRRALTLRVPRALVVPAGALIEGISRLLGFYPPFNREKARELVARWTCSTEKAVRLLGYRQQVDIEEGIPQTIAWYRTQGWL
ncbi:MAG: NAD-dependent epimerase/dehydratase family protein [Bacteroidota bacterium]|nr:NAD-dependent epimerase/dehydratase family protein [Bacteroidota bacterium]MDW8138251.1 NAD-dependent epimerase/dehydratase family protein [Bacteroidota bacterium]